MKRSTAPKSERSRPYLEESNMQNEAKKEIEITQPRTDSFRKRIRCLLFAVFLLTVYATGFLNLILTKGAGSAFTAFGIIKAFFTVRLTLIVFPAFFTCLSLAAIYSIYKTWEESLRDDKLNRGFIHSRNGSPYGDAHFEDPNEFIDAAQIRPVEKCKGKILGQLDREGRQCVDFNPYEGRINSHMIAIGRSGGGKTFTFVKNFMFQAQKEKHSLFVADPKGDLFREMSGYFRDNGYVVRKLDLKTLEKSDGWHCLGSLRGPNMITNTQIFSSTVMANISEKDDVYSRAGGSLLSALILRVLQGEDYVPERKNIKTVHELLQNPGGVEFFDQLLGVTMPLPSSMACTRFYMDFKRASGNLAGNVIVHLASGIQLFNNELIEDILSCDDIDLELPGRTPCIYFLNFPDTNDTFRFLVSLFFSMAFIVLVDYADNHTAKGKLPVPVDFLLDEFPALGIIPDWDRKIATVRSRDINLVMIVQDIPQLKDRYERSWMTILDNCGCLLTLGINEPKETAKWLSERIGEASIEVKSQSESVVAGKSKSFLSRQSVGVGKRLLLSPAEICEISRDGSVVIFTDHKPVYVNKIPYTVFPDADKLYDTQPEDVVDFNDRAGRKLLRAAEKEYREEYWKTHWEFPEMNYRDISDALFTEAPSGPFAMTISMLRDDMKAVQKVIISIFERIGRKAAGKGADIQMESAVELYGSGNELLFEPAEAAEKKTETAQKKAFQTFYEKYKAEHAYDSLNEKDTITACVAAGLDDQPNENQMDCRPAPADNPVLTDEEEEGRRRHIPESKSPLSGRIAVPGAYNRRKITEKLSSAHPMKENSSGNHSTEKGTAMFRTGVMPPSKSVQDE